MQSTNASAPACAKKDCWASTKRKSWPWNALILRMRRSAIAVTCPRAPSWFLTKRLVACREGHGGRSLARLSAVSFSRWATNGDWCRTKSSVESPLQTAELRAEKETDTLKLLFVMHEVIISGYML